MKIFLDDVRDAPDDSWVVVRSYNDFMALVTGTNEPITEISFDHDLGMCDGTDDVAETGMHAAKQFVSYAQDNEYEYFGDVLKKVIVHSSNPPGAANIAGYFGSAKKHGIFGDHLEIIVQPR